MTPPRTRAARVRSWTWLLVFAVWWSLAQLAVSAHVLQHVNAQAQQRDNPAQLPGPCDVCVVAAAIGGAAPPAVTAVPLLATVGHTEPEGPRGVHHGAREWPAYRSRAPPFLHA